MKKQTKILITLLTFFIILISVGLIIYDKLNNDTENSCCTCLDCPMCDVCCDCDNPYINS